MSEFDQLYREVILDHYKNPRGHGVIPGADAEAEGQNPLCGDEGSIAVGVYNCAGEYLAIEDRCSHDDGPLAEGDWEEDECVVICPRHGSRFDLRSGRPLSLPAFEPVDTFPVRVVDGIIRVDVT